MYKLCHSEVPWELFESIALKISAHFGQLDAQHIEELFWSVWPGSEQASSAYSEDDLWCCKLLPTLKCRTGELLVSPISFPVCHYLMSSLSLSHCRQLVI